MEKGTGGAGCPVGASSVSPRSGAQRLLPVVLFLLIFAVAYAMGRLGLISLENITAVHDRWGALMQEHRLLAILAYAGLYAAAGALCVPGMALLTAAGGLAFGTLMGTAATVVGATIGATALFMMSRSACSGWLERAEGPWLRKVRRGFEKNALSYLLFLRLVPAFPFWFVNVAAAVLKVPLRTFVIGTFIGIIPATLAYASAGAGLGNVIAIAKAKYEACLAAGLGAECKLTIPKSALFTKELVLALVLLGLLALIPVIVGKWRRSDVGAQ